MLSVISEKFKDFKDELDNYVLGFEHLGEKFDNQHRNAIRLFPLGDITINIKSFKIPIIFNQVAYRFFRKSKAQRSYEYGNKLLSLGIKTPEPIAYYEFPTLLLFKKSYYISEHLEYDYTYRSLMDNFDIPNYEEILRAFTRFTFELHEKGVHFFDHSPGNTLIKKVNGGYEFYLVDLNRMKFEHLDYKTRINNFSRLTIHKSMVEIMSDEYAKCIGKSYDEVFDLMWQNTLDFQEKYHRRKRINKKLKFWKKS